MTMIDPEQLSAPDLYALVNMKFGDPMLYECGCDGAQVGQAFDHGLLVCPHHREPVAPFQRPEQPARARYTLELELEGDSTESLRRFGDWLEGLAFPDSRVVALTGSFEER